MSLSEHLAELRTRLVRISLAVAVGALAGWMVYDPVLSFLKQPYCALPTSYKTALGECALIGTKPLEPFAVRVKVSLVIGLFLAAPVLFHQVWRFVTPGLTEKERRYTWPFVICSQVLFVTGAAFAFFIIPKGLAILIGLGGPQIAPLITAGDYFSFILWTVVGFGASFELPLMVVFLAAVGLVKARQLRQFRPYAWIFIFIFAALVTPTVDPVSMLFMAVPMTVLYEGAIVAAWMMERARRRREPSGEQALM